MSADIAARLARLAALEEENAALKSALEGERLRAARRGRLSVRACPAQHSPARAARSLCALPPRRRLLSLARRVANSSLLTLSRPRPCPLLPARPAARAGAPTGDVAGEGAGAGAAPERSYGNMKLWVGTWNMGAVDPFLDPAVLAASGAPPAPRAAGARDLSPFIPLGYDLYVLGVQEGIADAVFDAVEAHTGCFRLPLHAKLFPARDVTATHDARIRSRRQGRAIKAQAFLDDAKAGYKPELFSSTADMVRASPPSPSHVDLGRQTHRRGLRRATG